MTIVDTATPLRTLAESISDEASRVQWLIYKLTTAQLLVTAGHDGLVGFAGREVDRATETVLDAQARRARALERAARGARLPGASLAELVEVLPPPWDVILDDHREAALELGQSLRGAAERAPGFAGASITPVVRSLTLLGLGRPTEGGGR